MRLKPAISALTASLLFFGAMPLPLVAKVLDPNKVEVCVTQDQVASVMDVKRDAKGMQIYVIDGIEHLENKLSGLLPPFDKSKYGDANHYAEVVKPLILKWETEHKDQIKDAWNGSYTCLNYNVTETPAVIINSSYVVYGDTVSNAVKKWRSHTLKEQRQSEVISND